MENFIPKQKLLELKPDISFHKVGLQAYKFHSFLKPEENLELNQIEKVCLDNGRTDGINTIQEGLVIRNFMLDLDVEHRAGLYRINRDVDNDRKTHIIYGFGALEGQNQNTVKVEVIIHDSIRGDKKQEYWETQEEKNPQYFHWFEPFIIVNRRDDVIFNFKPNDKQYKIYGMTCEALGANVNG